MPCAQALLLSQTHRFLGPLAGPSAQQAGSACLAESHFSGGQHLQTSTVASAAMCIVSLTPQSGLTGASQRCVYCPHHTTEESEMQRCGLKQRKGLVSIPSTESSAVPPTFLHEGGKGEGASAAADCFIISQVAQP